MLFTHLIISCLPWICWLDVVPPQSVDCGGGLVSAQGSSCLGSLKVILFSLKKGALYPMTNLTIVSLKEGPSPSLGEGPQKGFLFNGNLSTQGSREIIDLSINR